MIIRAIADVKFIRRYLFVALICLGFAGWSLYDGLVAYPKQLERSQTYYGLKEPDEKIRNKMWRELALEKGWSQGIPDEVEKIEKKIVWQYIMAAVGLVVGLPMLIWYWRMRGSWIEASASGLKTSWGQTLDVKDIRSIDKTKWQKKGIARIQYEEGGTKRTFVLDDFKYQRAPIGQMLRLVESKLNADQIIGGQPEPQSVESEASG
jgi:hypothetical protein